ncbi:hypothetical protein [Frankia sp. Cas3]|uniref:hypothetical protein n=1 Tax=Frankia sp. Cas3 TaxID=3073926 RepID=UPI002AD599D9|nr:hypothetical protein [Frankia sp. Cas3]
MRSAEKVSGPRVVLDEVSFDFRGLSDSQIEAYLDEFNETLRTLRDEDSLGVSCAPMWEAVRCLDECEVYQFLCREYPSEVDRDTLVLAYSQLSRCPEWDDEAIPNVDATVSIDGSDPIMALSVAYASFMIMSGFGVACALFPGSIRRRGTLAVRGDHGESQVFFFCDPAKLPEFWRRLFALENVPEGKFFELGRRAFPDLVFHPSLSFNRFEGSYSVLRDRVVAVLAALNDRFVDEYSGCKGKPNEIQAAMGRYRLELSPESPKTRGSDRLMRQREVIYEGNTLRCEWHAKLERHRNRIHFSEPSEHLAGRILIGIFVSHLDT